MPQEPASIHRQFEQAFNAGDLDALTALYEPGSVLNFGDAPVRGLDAIRAAYSGFLTAKPQISLETSGVLETGEGLALLHGRWKLKGTSPEGAEFQSEGRNTEVVRRQPDGSWRFVIDNPVTP